MTRYLLDTNICIYLLKNRYDIGKRIKLAGYDNCFISDITLAELYYGASKSGQKAKKMQEVRFIEMLFRVLPIHEVLETFADIKTELNNKGLLIDDFDLLIGATAITYDLVLVTENIKHLARIPNIQIDCWVNR